MPGLLQNINGPQDLHELSDEQLQAVAQEVREHIIDTVGEIGGHFGANLGACELAVALHSVLNSPVDKILWDVGHQAYPHKILTGRRDQLETIRKYDGLAPFCAIHESEHDIMGAGHASTAIGYAVGIKEAMRRGHGQDGRVVAVVGDGAMTGGVAFEAVHQAGGEGTPIVVVLNDNGMSIAPNVGAMSRYFNRVRLNPKLWHAREGVEGGLTKLPVGIGAAFERLGPHFKESMKAFWAPGLRWSCTARRSRARALRRPKRAGWRAWSSGTRRSRSRSRTGRRRHRSRPSSVRRPRSPCRRNTRRCSARRSSTNAGATSA
jgi:1-deoxy-D-xylulose-5-phosphate synthase